jgi:hypothetical protein
MTVVAMTRREFSRLEVVVAIDEGQMTVSRAAELLRLSRRQIFRLLDRFRSIGPNGLALRKRGVPSNNQIHRSVRQLTMMLVRQHYADFGATLASEKLRELHDCRCPHYRRVSRRQRRLRGGRVAEGGLRYADARLSGNSEKPISIFEVPPRASSLTLRVATRIA